MEKQLTRINPKALLLMGVFGYLFRVFIKYSNAPSLVIATYRLGWTVLILFPLIGMKFRGEVLKLKKDDVLWNIVSGFFPGSPFFTLV